jgi:hypothetical protein
MKALKIKESNIKLINYWASSIGYEENRSICSGNCDDYCRCTTVNPILEEIYYNSIASDLINLNKFESEIQKYCVDRVVRKILNKNSFELYGISDYYGEIVECSICDNSSNELTKALEIIRDGKVSETIEYILELEYGYVLEDLKNKDWEIIETDIKNIIQNYVKVNKEIVDSYNGNEIILCRTVDYDKYQLIDGNHRFAAAKKNKKDIVKVLTTVFDK